MGTEVLRPHNCLIERIRAPPATVIPRRRSSCNNNNNNQHNGGHGRLVRTRRSKAAPVPACSPAIARRYSSDDLKRSKYNRNQNCNHKHSRSLSPNYGGDTYAGSAISVSPPPESLPLPSFSKRKEVIVDDSATRDLRRLLRMD